MWKGEQERRRKYEAVGIVADEWQFRSSGATGTACPKKMLRADVAVQVESARAKTPRHDVPRARSPAASNWPAGSMRITLGAHNAPRIGLDLVSQSLQRPDRRGLEHSHGSAGSPTRAVFGETNPNDDRVPKRTAWIDSEADRPKSISFRTICKCRLILSVAAGDADGEHRFAFL